jgi:hypothetical protein
MSTRISVVIEGIHRGHGVDRRIGNRQPGTVGPHRGTGLKSQHGGRDVNEQAVHRQGGQQARQAPVAPAHVQDAARTRRGEASRDVRMNIIMRVSVGRQELFRVAVVVTRHNTHHA